MKDMGNSAVEAKRAWLSKLGNQILNSFELESDKSVKSKFNKFTWFEKGVILIATLDQWLFFPLMDED